LDVELIITPIPATPQEREAQNIKCWLGFPKSHGWHRIKLYKTTVLMIVSWCLFNYRYCETIHKLRSRYLLCNHFESRAHASPSWPHQPHSTSRHPRSFPDSFSQNHLIVKVILDRIFIKELPSSSSNIYDHDFFYYDNCIKGSNSISRPLTCLPCCTSQLQHRSGSCHSLWSASSYTWWIVPVRTGTLMTSWLCRVEISYWVSGIHWVYYPKK
jgi:hypothetical protein